MPPVGTKSMGARQGPEVRGVFAEVPYANTHGMKNILWVCGCVGVGGGSVISLHRLVVDPGMEEVNSFMFSSSTSLQLS